MSVRFAPEDKNQWYGFVAMLATLLAVILPYLIKTDDPPSTIIVQVNKQEVVDQLKQYLDERLPKDSLEQADRKPHHQR